MTDAESIARMCAEQTSALLYNLRPDVIAYQKSKQHIIENCPFVEWEQDMGVTIQYCKLDNSFCNGQCFFKTNDCSCNISTGGEAG